ncbi:hypothetical protein KCU85_g637, partial [Aureobasidium melanogenum]
MYRKMSSKSVRPSGSGSGPGKPPGTAKWCEYHQTNLHDTIECRAAKQAGVVKQSKQEVKAAQAKKRNEWLGGIIQREIARRTSQLAANSSGQAAPNAANSSRQANPSAGNDNADPQDAAKDSEQDPNAAKGPDSAG